MKSFREKIWKISKELERSFGECKEGLNLSKEFQRLLEKFQRVLVGSSDSWRFFEILSRVFAGFEGILRIFGEFQ